MTEDDLTALIGEINNFYFDDRLDLFVKNALIRVIHQEIRLMRLEDPQ